MAINKHDIVLKFYTESRFCEDASLPVEELDCRDVIVVQPCIVGAQPMGKSIKYSDTGVVEIPGCNFLISLFGIKGHISHNVWIPPVAIWYHLSFQSCEICVHSNVLVQVSSVWGPGASLHASDIVTSLRIHDGTYFKKCRFHISVC